MKSKITVIFAPGNGGDGNTTYGWFAYVKEELEKLGITVISSVYPDPVLARMSEWLPFLESFGADENTIIIGHSSGAMAAMRYAETHNILGSVLVSPYHTDLGLDSEKQSGYFDTPFDWESMVKNQKWIIQFNSTNDPFIPIAEARFVYEKLGSEYHELTQGHFYPQETFPELVEAIKKKLQ